MYTSSHTYITRTKLLTSLLPLNQRIIIMFVQALRVSISWLMTFYIVKLHVYTGACIYVKNLYIHIVWFHLKLPQNQTATKSHASVFINIPYNMFTPWSYRTEWNKGTTDLVQLDLMTTCVFWRVNHQLLTTDRYRACYMYMYTS